MSVDSFRSNTKYYDSINFPHDFARAGIFTRKEADMLKSCGYVIKQLASGNMQPQDKEQENMIAMLSGAREPSTEVEKVWSKYEAVIRERMMSLSSFSNSSVGNYVESYMDK